MSSRSPKWVQTYIGKVAIHIITNPSRERILKGISSKIQEAFLELKSCLDKKVNIQNLRFSSKENQDLEKYKPKTCQTVILSKEQGATSGNVIFWYIADYFKIPNGKSYSDDATLISITGYRNWLWDKTKLLLTNTYYFSDYDLRKLEQNLAFISGASMNPARSLAPALVSGVLSNLWLYWSAKFIITSIIALMFRIMFASKRKP